MDAALVRERAAPDVGQVLVRGEVGDLGHEARDARTAARSRPSGRQRRSELELEVGDDRAEVGVAAALAVAVDRALHLTRARAHRGERVGDARSRRRCACGCRAGCRRARRCTSRTTSSTSHGRCRRWCRTARPSRRRRAPPRAASRARRPGRPCSRRRSARRRRSRAGRARAGTRPLSSIMRRFSSSVVRSTSVTCSVQLLPKTVHTGVPRLEQRLDVRVVLGRDPARGRSSRTPRSARASTGMSRARSKNSASFGFEPGQPPSMKATPNSSRRCGDAELVVDRERDALALRAVAERGVVDLDDARVGSEAEWGVTVTVRGFSWSWHVFGSGASRLVSADLSSNDRR